MVEHGDAGHIVGNNIDRIQKEFTQIMQKDREPKRPELWDGQTAEPCLDSIINFSKKTFKSIVFTLIPSLS